jgi:hypothetical protein
VSRATNSIRVFALYLFALGGALFAFPSELTRIGLPSTDEAWTHLLGLSTIVFGVVFWRAAAAQFVRFFEWSVELRVLEVLGIVLIVALRWAPPALLFLAGLEFAGALWTWTGLRADDQAETTLFPGPRASLHH